MENAPPVKPATETTDDRPQHLKNLRPWPKGKSGNPGGRPIGVARMIRSLTNDFQDQVRTLIEIAESPKTKPREKIEAIKLLMDRGLGKAIETTLTGELDTDTARDLLADLSGDQIVDLVKQLRETKSA